MSFDLETFAALAIMAFFAFVIWRGGSANPVGTGQLQRQLNTIGAKVNNLTGGESNIYFEDVAIVEAVRLP